MIEDAVGEVRRRLDRLGPASSDQIRTAASPTAGFSEAMNQELSELRAFLQDRVYGHRRVARVMAGAQQIVSDLFERYLNEPAALPAKWSSASPSDDRQGHARNVSDFIAGMTDRYAIGEHDRLFDHTPELR
jgi:dGTPase